MPNVYLKKELYDKVVAKGVDVSEFVNTAVAAKLEGKKQ